MKRFSILVTYYYGS